jgi:16S rRNA (guanine(966)-N(2))-methyltransferase RsmD
MRITGGLLRSRRLRVPSRKVRPSQDRVREALFSSLGERVVNARVLDLFAGSGALGLEAWSRGAASVCWVEADREAFRVLQQNVKALCTDPARETRCVFSDVYRFLRTGHEGPPFDLILADPPYDPEGRRDELRKTLRGLRQHSMLAADGVLVYEQAADEPTVDAVGWERLRARRYGQTRLAYYTQVKESTGGSEG